MFSGHPYLVAVPTPSEAVTYGGNRVSHNSLGFRGPETTREKPAGVTRIATLGASTTYSTGVGDDETWQRHLEAELGPGFEVLNFGVPGYTTVENLIQTALWLSDYQPDVAVYFEGWADARNQHIAHLAPDYSGFHGRFQFTNLRLDEMRPGRRSAVLFYLKGALDRLTPGLFYLSAHSEPGPGALEPAIDPRALDLYRRNLASIAALCRQQGIEPLFVPQRINPAALTADEPYGWLPYVRDRDVPAVIAAYNAAMEEVAAEEGVPFAREILDLDLGPADFVDQGHFSPSGTAKFARALAPVIERTLARHSGPGLDPAD
jgi:lysophospholipase L1-like esterase